MTCLPKAPPGARITEGKLERPVVSPPQVWEQPGEFSLGFVPGEAWLIMKLPFLISDGMVLQREKDVKLWGHADAGQNIDISFLGQSYTTRTEDTGAWEVTLGRLQSGGPHELTITAGTERVVIRDVLVGDVWLCSGQSNMELMMQRVRGKYPEDMKANNPCIRQFKVPQEYDFHGPRKDYSTGQWVPVSPETVENFTAVGYFFAKALYARYGVPIGLLASAVGGTPIHAWMGRDLLVDFPEALEELRECEDDAFVARVRTEDDARIEAFGNALDTLDHGLKERWFAAGFDDSYWDERNLAAPFEGDLQLPGAIWMRKTIDVPETLAGKPATLYFGTVTDADFIYVNGELEGNTTYRYPPREYRIKALPKGRCVVALRLLSFYGCGGVVENKLHAISCGEQTLSLEGNWRYRRGAAISPLLPGRQFHYTPTGLYNGMITPLTNLAVKGVLWYQGETDSGRPERYGEKFEILVNGWRRHWGGIPFLYVQLPNYKYAEGQFWPLLREQQRRSLKIPNTAMVVTIDVGEYNDLHPLDKEAVGQRLALAAIQCAYGEDIVCSGPLIREARAEGNTLVLFFDHARGGLFSPNNPLTGFEISGKDGEFVPAAAVISADTVRLTCPAIKRPHAARFGWENAPEQARLYNKEGLPASPFEIKEREEEMSRYDIKKEAADLVARMTLEEKVSQMLHGASAVKRLNIPSYNWWNEALHGVARAGTATMFPQAIALAATFDPVFLREVAGVISTEGRAKFNAAQEEGDHDIYKGLTFWSPNINIFRDPRWGRGHETYGEDPFLTARLGVAFIKGLQGEDRDSLKVAACAKHFAVHSGPESERHEFNAIVDRYDLWNTYLAAFEAAVREGGVEAVMGAYNRTLGEPCCGSRLLLKEILRGKWGFDGHVVSDCWAIKDFHENHRVTGTPVESVALAISNGCDINCGNLFGYCLQAIREGLLTEEQIDTAVTRLFVSRMRLGLLGAPENEKYAAIPYEAVDSEAHRRLNLEAARRSLVLLKNDGALPLKGIKTIGVIGPNADSRRALQGNYEGTASQHITVLDGIRAVAGAEDVRVFYALGCHLYKNSISNLGLGDDRLAEAAAVAKHSDAIVLVLGLDADIEGEEGDASNEFSGGDKLGLELPGRQQALVETVLKAANSKPVIVVLVCGSALTLGAADAKVNGILQAFYPGAQGGLAIAEALFGKFSPSGKLPVTFYRATTDLPDFRDYSMENRTYRYFKGEALYPFGFGIGYGKFVIQDLEADCDSVSATVSNIGGIAARETVQLYARAEGEKERWSLAAVKPVYLEQGESAKVTLAISASAFHRYDSNGDVREAAGKRTLYLGFTQPDARSVKLYGQAPLKAEI